MWNRYAVPDSVMHRISVYRLNKNKCFSSMKTHTHTDRTQICITDSLRLYIYRFMHKVHTKSKLFTKIFRTYMFKLEHGQNFLILIY